MQSAQGLNIVAAGREVGELTYLRMASGSERLVDLRDEALVFNLWSSHSFRLSLFSAPLVDVALRPSAKPGSALGSTSVSRAIHT